MEVNKLKEIEGRVLLGYKHDDENLWLIFREHTVHFYHSQDCCESVYIDDINGDFEDLKGDMIMVAEERCASMEDDGFPEEFMDHESCTWTFYTFRGLQGSVDVRWLGVSNGYYSEAVSMDVRKHSNAN